MGKSSKIFFKKYILKNSNKEEWWNEWNKFEIRFIKFIFEFMIGVVVIVTVIDKVDDYHSKIAKQRFLKKRINHKIKKIEYRQRGLYWIYLINDTNTTYTTLILSDELLSNINIGDSISKQSGSEVMYFYKDTLGSVKLYYVEK